MRASYGIDRRSIPFGPVVRQDHESDS